MDMAVKEKGALPVFADCQKLFEEAHAEYLARHVKQGYFKLGEARKLLKKRFRPGRRDVSIAV
jgi:hypothetical protein